MEDIKWVVSQWQTWIITLLYAVFMLTGFSGVFTYRMPHLNGTIAVRSPLFRTMAN